MSAEAESLRKLVQALPPDLQAEVRDFIEFLLSKRKRETEYGLPQNRAGKLREYSEQYTSLELQENAKRSGRNNPMSNITIAKVVKRLETLPEALQAQVLSFVEALDAARPQGVSGDILLQFAGVMNPDEARQMSEVIATGCEQVDLDEW